MGGGGKGGSSAPQYTSADAYNLGRSMKEGNKGMSGFVGWTPDMEGYDYVAQGYLDAHNEKVAMENMKMMFSQGQESQANAYAQMQAAQAEAMEEARIAGLTSKRDAMIGGYFDAANSATTYVSEKIAQEKANAALMGVDYSMTDELKNERISNYFSSLWSEGNQSELEASFGEIGAGDFEQTIWRGKGVEAEAPGSVGEQKAGGSITPKSAKKTLIDDEAALGANTSILGA